MPDKLYIACIRWMTTMTPSPDRVKETLDRTPGVNNWARVNVHVWLVKTSLSAEAISEVFRGAISKEDGLFVIAANPHDYSGFAPTLIWDWLRDNFGARLS